MRNLLIFVVAVSSMLIFGSCLKSEDTTTYQKEFQSQLSTDKMTITQFLVNKGIKASEHESGIFFAIEEKGTGDYDYVGKNPTIRVNYTGRLLDGTVFDSTEGKPIEFKLGQVILGWQIGIQLIQKGGKIRLIIPSGYAYGNRSAGKIPANAILDFDIELIDIK